jgi:hypothetical protein
VKEGSGDVLVRSRGVGRMQAQPLRLLSVRAGSVMRAQSATLVLLWLRAGACSPTYLCEPGRCAGPKTGAMLLPLLAFRCLCLACGRYDELLSARASHHLLNGRLALPDSNNHARHQRQSSRARAPLHTLDSSLGSDARTCICTGARRSWYETQSTRRHRQSTISVTDGR